MKIFIILSGIFLLVTINSIAQTTIKDVHFDNYVNASNNDFTNFFTGSSNLYQIPSNGITGGCLAAPDSNNWGNDNAQFCSSYSGLANSNYRTSICFKYDSTLVNPNSYDRVTSIWMVPYTDFNHYLITSITHDKRVQVISYSYVNPTAPVLNLQHNNWYRLTADVTYLTSGSNTIQVAPKVYSLGPNGTSTPSLISSLIQGSFSDSTLFKDTSIIIGITGARYGGTIYLDDFHFEGKAGVDNCPLTGINSVDLQQQIIFKQVLNTITISNNSNYVLHTTIYDANGRSVNQLSVPPGVMEFDLNKYTDGIYIFSGYSTEGVVVKKVLVNHH
jgi:hypothetical protein